MCMLKALCVMLMASTLCHGKFRKDIEAEGYQINPHGICAANKIIKGKQHSLTRNVDGVKVLHVDIKFNDTFY